MGEAEKTIEFASEGAIAGSHQTLPIHPATVGPTTENQSNHIIAALTPIACWLVDDVRFEYNSSIIRPELRDEIKKLFDLRERHKLKIGDSATDDETNIIYPPLSIFGHADPVGQDEYNKKLSGRRATAVYALLVRNTGLWEELYTHPIDGSGDQWSSKSVKIMLAVLGYDATEQDPAPNNPSDNQIRNFQSDQGLKADGQAGPKTRAKLFLAYMNWICGDDEAAKLDDENDFLAGGTDPHGKGDYQGCGEFNALMLFSQQEEQVFAQPENRLLRDAENAPNRRVMVLLFRPGSQVQAAKWPCPRVNENTSGCKKRFWSDGEKRRSERLPSERREYKKTRDTFGCRFYDRLASESPCEALQKRDLRASLCTPYESREIFLTVEDGAGKEVSRLSGEKAEREDNLFTFELSTSRMPNPSQLKFLTPDGEQLHGAKFNPEQLSEAFAAGDLELASQIFGEPKDPLSALNRNDDAEPPSAFSERSASSFAVADKKPPAPTKAVSVIRIELSYNNPRHRFIKNMTVKLENKSSSITGNEVVAPKLDDRKKGKIVFELPNVTGDSLELQMTIDDPGSSANEKIIKISQSLKIDKNGIDPKLVPLSGVKGGLHPRLTLTDVKGIRGLFRLQLDLTFLDLTNRLKRENKSFRDFTNISSLNCRYRVLEFTGGEPTTWGVIMPPAVNATRVNHNVFLFFRNETKVAHKNSDELDYKCIRRYFDAPQNEGSYLQGSLPSVSFQEYPFYGWDKQLSNSQKPVITLFPIPHVIGFGAAGIPATGGPLVREALKCLWAENVIAVGVETGPQLARLAIGGFSSGTDDLLRWCGLDGAAKIVDEIYFFDGKGQALPNFAAWLANKEKRMLRLIGTGYSATSFFQVHKSIKSGDVLRKPESFNYWFTNNDYKKAHLNAFLRLPGAPASTSNVDATKVSEVFLDKFQDASGSNGPSGAFVKLRWTEASGKSHTNIIQAMSPVEAASLIHFSSRKKPYPRPVKTVADFNILINNLSVSDEKGEPNTTLKLRHPWSIVGGEWGYTTLAGLVKPSTEFISFFQICLLESGFV